MEMKTKLMIGGGAVAALAALFFLYKKNKIFGLLGSLPGPGYDEFDEQIPLPEGESVIESTLGRESGIPFAEEDESIAEEAMSCDEEICS